MKSTWHAAPSNARWYCEVIFGKEDNDTDYNSGYSKSVEKPDLDSVWDLVPAGYTIIEYSIHMTPQHEGAVV